MKDKILGIIAEYNPFHNGHLYHLKKAKELTGAKYTVCVMSGNFVQRGNTSIVNKWIKAQIALYNQVDLVIELPTIYSISSAENFALGSIKILEQLKVDNIVFGTETEDFAALNNISKILYQEPKEYKNILNIELKKGISFPKARENALSLYLNDEKRYSDILKEPNNILAIEYLKALKKIKSKIEPISIKREKVYYNDESIIDDFASATAIRKIIENRQFTDLLKVVPRSCYNMIKREYEVGNVILDLSKYEKEIIYNLRKMSIAEIAKLPDVSEGLEYSIKNAVNYCNNIKDLINLIKTKRYTHTRIQRILLYSLLGITKEDLYLIKNVNPYIRVLGFNENGKKLISEIIKENPKLEIITSVKKFVDRNNNKAYKRIFEIDKFATDVYTLGYKEGSLANLDFTKGIIIE